MKNKLLGSSEFKQLLLDHPMTCLDIGSRRGFVEDLLPIAPAIDAIGFEADKKECDRLNKLNSNTTIPWRSLKHLAIALGDGKKNQSLNIYNKKGCSSLLQADVELAESFSRGEYYKLVDNIELETIPLDKAAEKYNFTDAVYMKIDVEGTEINIINSGPLLLNNNILAIRTEVAFNPILKKQCTFKDVDGSLRSSGFIPMMFLDQHHWRRTTKVKLPRLSKGPLPYSKGQLINGDILYFKDPNIIPNTTSEDIKTLLNASFIALAYGFVDHALFLMQRPSVKEYLISKYNIEPENMISDISHDLASSYLKNKWKLRLNDFKSHFKQSIN